MISPVAPLVPLLIIAWAIPCNAMELKDITFKTRDAGKVVFSHRTHLAKKTRTAPGFSCRTCHEGGKLKTRRYTMAEMEKGRSCGACHEGARAFPLKECSRCHKVREVTYSIRETGPLVFSHTSHLRSMQCGACHNRIFKTGANPRATMAEMEKGRSCGACHDGKSAFTVKENCERCHRINNAAQRLRAGGGGEGQT